MKNRIYFIIFNLILSFCCSISCMDSDEIVQSGIETKFFKNPKTLSDLSKEVIFDHLTTIEQNQNFSINLLKHINANEDLFKDMIYEALIEKNGALLFSIFEPESNNQTLKVQFAVISPSGKYLLIARQNKVIFYCLISRKTIAEFKNHIDYVYKIKFVNEQQALTVGPDRITSIDLKNRKQSDVMMLNLKNFIGGTFQFSPNDKQVLAGCETCKDHGNRRVVNGGILYDLGNGKESEVIRENGHTTYIRAIAFSPDNKYLLTGSEDDDENAALLWDFSTKKVICLLKGHRNDVVAAAFSPCGNFALTGSWDDTAILWDLTDKKNVKLITKLEGHKESVYAVTFSPCGKFALTGSNDQTAILWDLHNLEQIVTLNGHSGGVDSLFFDQDSHFVLTCSSDDNTVRFWDLNLPHLSLEQLVLILKLQKLIEAGMPTTELINKYIYYKEIIDSFIDEHRRIIKDYFKC